MYRSLTPHLTMGCSCWTRGFRWSEREKSRMMMENWRVMTNETIR